MKAFCLYLLEWNSASATSQAECSYGNIVDTDLFLTFSVRAECYSINKEHASKTATATSTQQNLENNRAARAARILAQFFAR